MDELELRLEELIPHLKGAKVMVVGDLLADRYVFAEPSRLSREAPVVVARYEDDRFVPGGAANAVRNLCDLGADVLPVGILGEGKPGLALRECFEDAGVNTAGIVVGSGFTTVTKTRFMVGEQRRTRQQVFRIDREPDGPPPADLLIEMRAFLFENLSKVDAILISDYGYGVIDRPLAEEILAARGSTIVTADSRYRISEFRGIDLATPNVGELEATVGRPVSNSEDLEDAGRQLLEELGSRGLLVTRGNQGMSLFEADGTRLDIDATGVDEVTDVSGAGDTVIAVATLALAAGGTLEEAAFLANLAAGVVVTKAGPATCTPRELEAARRNFF